MDLQERVKQLEEQSEQAKTLFLKCQGAVEVLKGLIEEEAQEKKDEKDLASKSKK
tara:strand:+ start:711 stop:875 length:165 start_codon:yes stop_codon:yes gene_type:complete